MHLTVALGRLTVATGGAAEAQVPADDPWSIPAEHSCRTKEPLAPGRSLIQADLESLREYLPHEVWDARDRFFHEGMLLEVGPCYRDYSVPAFFRDATERFRRAGHFGSGRFTWVAFGGAETNSIAEFFAVRLAGRADRAAV